MDKKQMVPHRFFESDPEKVIKSLGKEVLVAQLKKMLLIRQFEIRAESAYLQGKIGGFFHSYMGQEAVQTAAVASMGVDQWWSTSYRCHALALLLGATPNELMAELFGRASGNARGRGGSMHFFTERLLGGFGIVGGQIPIGTGAAFTVKYLKDQKITLSGPQPQVSVCFFGDGAVAQGAFHESLNLAALWDLPCIYVIENNQWGMGTHVKRAISVDGIAEKKAPSFGMESYVLDGMDFFNCYAGFEHIYQKTQETSRPCLVEVITERFRGHSISDPALYRTKVELQDCIMRDPLSIMFKTLLHFQLVTEEEYAQIEKEMKEVAVAALKYAEESPWPDLIELEEDVLKG